MLRGGKRAAMRVVRRLGGVSFLYRFLAFLATDITPPQSGGPLLVIAPHPDDETLGCAATILRAREAGRRTVVIIVSDGSQSFQSALISPEQLIALRVDEATAAAGVLGVGRQDVIFLAFPDGRLQENRAQIAAALQIHVAALYPVEIYAPYGIDQNPDHRAVAASVDDLVKAAVIVCPVYEYPIWFWPRLALAHLAMPGQLARLRRVPSADWLAKKRAAMQEYRSQCENITGEADIGFLDPDFLENFFKPYELYFQKR